MRPVSAVPAAAPATRAVGDDDVGAEPWSRVESPKIEETGDSRCYHAPMGVVDRRQELVEHILRLRRVGRELPGSRDIAEVRSALERELGGTVSRRLAARVLGVDHKALNRWIDAGDLPVVFSPSGHVQVPVRALLELREAVDADRERGSRRYPLTPSMKRGRADAERLRLDDLTEGDELLDGHDRARARSLAYHRAIARRLRRPMVDEARHTLFGLRQSGRIAPRYADRWEEILDRTVPEIRRALVKEDQETDDLRQNSPFAGMLSEPERRRIVESVR